MKHNTIATPFSGETVALSTLNDPVFNSGMVGAGIAVRPVANAGVITVHSPVSATVLRVMPHAIVLLTEDKKGILVHVGIDTVSMEGQGFSPLVEPNQIVLEGQPLLTADIQAIIDTGLDPVTPVILMDGSDSDITLITPPAATVTDTEILFEA